MHRIRTRLLGRFTAIALVAIIAGQFAVAGHTATAHHGVGERCDVCLGADRLAHAVAELPRTVTLPPAPAATDTAEPSLVPVLPAIRRHARAPPIL